MNKNKMTDLIKSNITINHITITINVNSLKIPIKREIDRVN